jgi:hypothetical protein
VGLTDKERRALEMARLELVSLNGLTLADGAAPQETWICDTKAVLAAIDEVLPDTPFEVIP